MTEKGKTEIDATGKIVAPGFIDAHTHDDRLMLSSPDMAPKVSQGVTTVVAGNCGISLAPAPKGMKAPVAVPLDLLDDAGGWFRFRTFEEYVEALKREARGHQLRAARRPLHAAGADDGRRGPSAPASRKSAQMRAMVDEAHGGRRDRGVDRALLRAGARRALRGSDRDLPAAIAAQRHLLHAHARRGRARPRFARGELPRRARARHAGGDLAPQGGGQGEPRPLGRDAAVHREGDALAEDRPRLLSVPRLFHHPLGEPRGEREQGDGHLVEAASRSGRHGARRNPRPGSICLSKTCCPPAPSTSPWTRRTCSASWASSTP